jgi:hypothetical protein
VAKQNDLDRKIWQIQPKAMSAFLTTAVASACLLAAVWLGIWLRHFLPQHHLSPDSRDTVKLAMGLVATMTALLLGLLVSSAKTSYDTTRAQVMERAAKFSLLARVLGIYGTPAAEVRGELHDLIEEATRQLWPDSNPIRAQSQANPEIGKAFYVSLLKLEARDDIERALKAQAVSLTVELGQLQSLMQAESTTAISKPMLIVVVLWLVMIFLSFSLIAPSNFTTNFALIASALCVAGALFLILELDRPFDGLMRISSEPMLNVLHQPGNETGEK